MYESNDKMVSHPDHYQSEKGIELIDVIEGEEEVKRMDALLSVAYVDDESWL